MELSDTTLNEVGAERIWTDRVFGATPLRRFLRDMATKATNATFAAKQSQWQGKPRR
jgi:hypothetical protein